MLMLQERHVSFAWLVVGMVVRRDQEQAKSEDVYTPAKLLSYQAYLKNTAS